MVSIFRPAAVDFENIDLKLYSETKFFSTIDIADKVQLDFWRTPLLLLRISRNFWLRTIR
jgi:hypothetical protein